MKKNKMVVVTGAASGIGAATAELLLEEGYEVFGIDRNPCHGSFDSIIADLSTEAGVDAAINALPATLYGFCNIAGVPGTAPAHLAMAVNVNAVRKLTKAAGDRIVPGGSIVNLASLAGSRWAERRDQVASFLNSENWDDSLAWYLSQEDLVDDPYRFSKECVIVFSGRSADEYIPRGIRVNSVSPGPVETPIFEDFKESLGRQMIQDAVDLIGRAGTPHDIAPVITFLLSDKAQWINGMDIKVDGGLAAHRAFGKQEAKQ